MAKRSRATPPRLNPLYNTLAMTFVALSCLCMCGTLAIFAMPGLAGPLQGPTEVAEVVFPPTVTALTPTPTDPPTQGAATFPPTWTPVPPTETPTRPTSTPSETPTETPVFDTRTPTHTPTHTPTPTRTTTALPPTRTPSPFAWTLQTGSPAYLRNYVNTAGCNWMGIVGQAFGLDGRPQLNLYVHFEGAGLSGDGVTGSQPAIGPGAYQIILSDRATDTTDTYRIQLRNTSGQALSDTYMIPTKSDCAKNLILVNFEQNR